SPARRLIFPNVSEYSAKTAALLSSIRHFLVLLRSFRLTMICACISLSLSPALTLYYIEEKKYEDICTIMDMNYQSVRNLMHRGITRLRELVG
ncbi:RNA polymerase sigma factor, partial [Phocaeicola sp.]|uniref:RNA polymerase sigma factor n=1 Tax=Phocaeicola sp. TaxID=2773926 RepID=UPI003AB23320